MYNFFNLIGKIRSINNDATKIIIDVSGKMFELSVEEKLAENSNGLLNVGKIIGVTGELSLVNNKIVCNVRRITMISSHL